MKNSQPYPPALPAGNPPRFLRLPDVKHRTALSKASIYKRMRDETFPQAIRMGKRFTVWLESDIETWIAYHAIRRQQ